MKLALMMMAALMTFATFSAEAKKRELPGRIDKVGKALVISIPALRRGNIAAASEVSRMINRSSFDPIYNERNTLVIEGRYVNIDNAPFLRRTKTLNKEMLMELIHNQNCDLDLIGACLVYTKYDGEGHAVVVGTREIRGTSYFIQGAYERVGRGSNSIDSITENMKDRTKSKYMLFTRAEAGDGFGDDGDDRDGRGGRRGRHGRDGFGDDGSASSIRWESNSGRASRSSR